MIYCGQIAPTQEALKGLNKALLPPLQRVEGVGSPGDRPSREGAEGAPFDHTRSFLRQGASERGSSCERSGCFESDMDELEGPWSSARAAAAAAGNASWTEDAGLGVSGRVQLVLEILMVLMCVGAVTGTQLPVSLKASIKLITDNSCYFSTDLN